MDWRIIGDLPYSTWSQVITKAGGPDGLAAMAAWDAARPHSALALAQMGVESRFGTAFAVARPEQRNALGLSSGGRVATYPSWAEGLAEWKRRLTDPSYKNGVYAKTKTIEELVAVYAPATDPRNNPPAYVAKVKAMLAGWGIYLEEEEPVTYTFGRVALPPFTERLIPDKQTVSWDNLGQRAVHGVVYHRMLGSLASTDSWFRQSAANGGKGVGLTDWGVDHRTGLTYRWNDPRGVSHAGVSANRSPWASGPADDVEGDGVAFIAKYGRNGINRLLTAIEISGFEGDQLSDKAIQQVAQLTAYWADQAQVPWDQFPFNPATGCSFTYWHSEFAAKQCPFTVVKAITPDIVAKAREILRVAQTTAQKKPMPIPDADIQRLRIDGRLIHLGARELTASSDTERRQYADVASSAITTLPSIKKGDKVRGMYAVIGNNRFWYVLDDWSRVDARAFV